MDLNNVNMMGNLTRNPEIKHIPSGKAVCIIPIATNRIYIKNREKINEISYFDVEVWGTIGENCAKYLTKGSGVIVEGRLRQERWEKDGNAHSHVRIVADAVHFLPKRKKNAAGQDPTVPYDYISVEEEKVVIVSSEVAA